MRLPFFVMGMLTAFAIDNAFRGVWWAVAAELVLLIAMLCVHGREIWHSGEQK